MAAAITTTTVSTFLLHPHPQRKQSGTAWRIFSATLSMTPDAMSAKPLHPRCLLKMSNTPPNQPDQGIQPNATYIASARLKPP